MNYALYRASRNSHLDYMTGILALLGVPPNDPSDMGDHVSLASSEQISLAEAIVAANKESHYNRAFLDNLQRWLNNPGGNRRPSLSAPTTLSGSIPFSILVSRDQVPMRPCDTGAAGHYFIREASGRRYSPIEDLYAVTTTDKLPGEGIWEELIHRSPVVLRGSPAKPANGSPIFEFGRNSDGNWWELEYVHVDQSLHRSGLITNGLPALAALKAMSPNRCQPPPISLGRGTPQVIRCQSSVGAWRMLHSRAPSSFKNPAPYPAIHARSDLDYSRIVNPNSTVHKGVGRGILPGTTYRTVLSSFRKDPWDNPPWDSDIERTQIDFKDLEALA